MNGTKLVNIYPAGPLVVFTPPVTSPIMAERHTTGTILHCLQSGARVEEILENGGLVVLNFKNYDADNSEAEVITPAKEEKVLAIAETSNEVVEPQSQPVEVETKVEAPAEEVVLNQETETVAPVGEVEAAPVKETVAPAEEVEAAPVEEAPKKEATKQQGKNKN